ncbi:efflux RND transporter periplasmic adaptor subunit [Helicovermis profundi]|uniref:Efflux RND transporter periplasmic adaptor subunit n=1 Tax=Helicovermis profundi TaxID=3065157 RepID=A0AAU9E3Q1_9FIRM|nr:efflux RND transporter periplasmic adaptor subunit [Clostridia bacterium S502]
MKKKLIIAFIVFTAIGAGIFYFLTTANIGEKYNTVEVKKGEMKKYVQDVGRISSKNIRRYYGNGLNKVEKIPLELGEHVKKGQLLVKYEDNIDLEIQKIQKQIEALEATYRNALSGTDKESINNSIIEISRIKNLLQTATKNKDKTEELFTNGVVSHKELEDAVNNMKQLQSSLKTAENTYNQLTKGISKNIKKKYEAEIEAQLISLKLLEKKRSNYEIYANIDGIVTELNTFEGDIPSPSTKIIEIQDPTEKVILVDFLAEKAINIRENFAAEISDTDFNINKENLKVNRIYPKAFMTLSELGVKENRQTVEIDLPKSAETLPFGIELETKVIVNAPREVLIIPIGATFQKSSKTFVKVLEDGKLVEKEIISGEKWDGNIEVKSGLKVGDLVILNYQEN